MKTSTYLFAGMFAGLLWGILALSWYKTAHSAELQPAPSLQLNCDCAGCTCDPCTCGTKTAWQWATDKPIAPEKLPEPQWVVSNDAIVIDDNLDDRNTPKPAKKAKKKDAPTCPDCGTTLVCPKCNPQACQPDQQQYQAPAYHGESNYQGEGRRRIFLWRRVGGRRGGGC